MGAVTTFGRALTMDLQALLEQPVTLPSMPRAVALLRRELAHDEPDLRRLNQIFASDPALAARLLAWANAPRYLCPRQVHGVPQALVLLDVAHLRALVDSAALGTTAGSVPGMNLQQFWRYSLQTARLARSLAGCVRQPPTVAYTAGLLHGLGELVIHLAAPATAQALNGVTAALGVRRARLERRSLGFCYARVSARLAQQWNLPEAVVTALQHMTQPLDDGVYEPLAAVLHLAAWRARAHEAGMGDKDMAVSFPDQIGLALGLDIDMVLQQDPIDWMARPDASHLV